jgi:hypothetical protein
VVDLAGPVMVNLTKLSFPWQRKPMVLVEPSPDPEGLNTAWLLLLFWALPVMLTLTHGHLGIGRLVPKALFSHEDANGVHKLLGFGCLLHFLVRCAWLTSDMAFDTSLLTPACIAMHGLLSVSSLIFHIPKVRIKEGSRIWPEFRLHSIVFACRSLACMLIVWAERRYLTPGAHAYWANVLVVFATLIGADVATNSVDPRSRSNTIRGLDTGLLYKYSFSMMQFLGTTGCLVGLRSFAAQFAIVFIIQTYAFTLTLRRKNLLSHRATVVIYASQLTLGVTVANMEVINHGGIDALFMFVSLALAAGSLRMLLGMNKYLMWALMSVAVQFARKASAIVPESERIDEWPALGWPVTTAVLGSLFLTGVWFKEARRAAERAAQKVL